MIRSSHNLLVYHVSFLASNVYDHLFGCSCVKTSFCFVCIANIFHVFLSMSLETYGIGQNCGMQTSHRAKQMLIVWVHYTLVESRRAKKNSSYCEEKTDFRYFSQKLWALWAKAKSVGFKRAANGLMGWSVLSHLFMFVIFLSSETPTWNKSCYIKLCYVSFLRHKSIITRDRKSRTKDDAINKP